MKSTVFITAFFLLLYSQLNAQSEFGSFTDPRDGHTYKTVKIGSQIWFAENLAYKTKLKGPKMIKFKNQWFVNENIGKETKSYYSYNKKRKNADKYGYLYSYKVAKVVCPKGWHLPSKSEFDTLINYIQSVYNGNTYDILIDGGSSGFNAILSGMYSATFNDFEGLDAQTVFWSSTLASIDEPFVLDIHKKNKQAGVGIGLTSYYFSIRCIKD